MDEYTRQVDHTRIVMNSLEKLSGHLKSAEIYTPSYPTLYSRIFKLYKNDAESLPDEIEKLKALTNDNPTQQALIDSIGEKINRQLPVLMQKNFAEIISSGQVWRLEFLAQIHNRINESIQLEIKLLEKRKNDLERSTKQNRLLTIAFSVIAFGLTISSIVYNMVLIRKRQWLEGFLESVLNTSQNGIIHFKAIRERGTIKDFKVEFANTAIKDQLGIHPIKIIDSTLNDLNFITQGTDEWKQFLDVIDTGRASQFEMFYDVNGKKEWFFIMLAKMEDGLTATLQNITQIRQYQDELTRNIQQLEHSNSELEQYAYVASHDLQEPLRKIMIYGGLLKEHQINKLDEKGKTHLQKINQSAERLSILIHEILKFSGVKREKIFVETDLNFILQQVLTDLELSIEQTRTIISVTSLPTIEVIPLQISQLFFNLLVNAIKFTKEGETPVIHITSRLLDQNELEDMDRLDHKLSYYELLVSDNGIGFNQQYARQIFGMFKRLNDKTAYPGSGIGLALCEKVATNHNGKIFATSEEGKGTTFHIILPAKQ